MTDQLSLIAPAQSAPGDELDFWETPASAIAPIMEILWERLSHRSRHVVIDPGCGLGSIAIASQYLQPRAIIGIEVHPERAKLAAERVQPGCVVCTDFLGDEMLHQRQAIGEPVLVFGNPPYSKPRKTIGVEFAERAITLANPHGIACLLLPLDYAAGVGRCERLHERYSCELYPLKRRPAFANNDTGKRPVAWFLWDRVERNSEWRPIG